MNYWPILLAAGALLVVASFIARRLRAASAKAKQAHAIAEFAESKTQLAAEFFHAAATSGKPRGLRWLSCDLDGEPLFARERATGHVYALAPVTISFEAVAGGGMDEVEAVGNLRSATAVFVHRGREWSADGRVIFNLEPAESLRRFESVLEPLSG